MSDWLRRPRPRPLAPRRVVAFPHAGGAASFFGSWAADLPAGVELVAVQYPGRADRLDEPAIDRMGALADQAAEAVLTLADRPFVLFGHSMGALVAYEVALRVQRRTGMALAGLVVSGECGPALLTPGDRHLWSDQRLWDEVRRLNGTDARVLEHEELAAMVLPRLRGDYRLIEEYRPRLAELLDCPVTALVGDRDTEVTVEEARGWRDTTRSSFELQVFPGGDHFYLVRRRVQVIHHVLRCLGVAPQPAGLWPSTP
jgi:pyochelin biosynthesis protein PchC